MLTNLEKRLIKHEGIRLAPYKCTAGKTTIGVGRNLDSHGISQEEAIHLLRNDIESCKKQLGNYPWYTWLDQVRQDAIIEMAFNLGMNGLCKFKRMIAALSTSGYAAAAQEALDSSWAKQVGPSRSQDIAYRLERGLYK